MHASMQHGEVTFPLYYQQKISGNIEFKNFQLMLRLTEIMSQCAFLVKRYDYWLLNTV